jgi:Domain of unknown function (DUF4268)
VSDKGFFILYKRVSFFFTETVIHYFACMFNRQQASQLNEEFWTTLGRYMRPVPSADGHKINWINYKTALKQVHFRMDVQPTAIISISIEHADAGIRALYFHQFEELKPLLQAELQEEWQWQLERVVAGRSIASIYKELPDVSVFNKDHWPALIAFFKPRLIALDRFWAHAHYSFEAL